MSIFRRTVAPVVEGYPIGSAPGYWSAVKAESTENLITNPSFDIVTGGGVPVGYAVLSAPTALARVTTWQRRGLYAGQVTIAGGIYYEITLTAGQVYTFSCDVKGTGGDSYRIYFGDAGSGGARLSNYVNFTSRGRVQRPYVTYTAPSTKPYWLILERTSGNSAALSFYTDGWQCEAKSYPTTYCDGSLRGFVLNRADYYWRGAPNASASIRIAQSRAGGRVYPLGNYGLNLLGMVGLGQSGVLNYLSPLTNGGSYYYGSNITERQFTLAGAIEAPRGLEQLHRNRAGLADLFSFENTVPEQPMLLRYKPTECKDFDDEYFEITALPENGMSGSIVSEWQERVALPFTLYTTYTAKKWGDVGSALTFEQSLSNANLAMVRDSNGAWAAIDVDANVYVLAFARLPDGRYVFGGEWTDAGGVANTASIAIYDPSANTFSAMGTGVIGAGEVRALATDAVGNVYAVGSFTSMGGVANTQGMARWNYLTSAWVSIGNATGGTLQSVFVASTGIVYFGGDTTSFGGTAATRIASYNGAAFSAMSTGLSSTVFSIVQSPSSGQIYAAAGNAGVYYWDGATWNLIGAPNGATNVFALAFRPDGVLFAGGSFATIGGVSAPYAAFYLNGWFDTQAAFNNQVRFIFYSSQDNAIYFTGSFTQAVGRTLSVSAIKYIGNQFFELDFIPPGSPTRIAIYSASPEYLFVGFNAAGTATVPGKTSITNTGTSPTSPIITIAGPATVLLLQNYTTGQVLFFDLALLAGEVATLDFSFPQQVKFGSNFRGNLLSTIARNSSFDFSLLRGVNSVGLFMQDDTAATAANIVFTPVYSSVDAWALERRLP